MNVGISIAQVVKECKLEEGTKWEFTELLFQPVPWSPFTKKGMPQVRHPSAEPFCIRFLQEFEIYLEDPNYTVINVPPTVMFKAKVLFH